jgi:phthiocerol/phenolphthiocerol synthesis type-I polyketide synthase E
MHDMSAAFSAGDTGHHIAVIGMAGRFPGAPDVDRFWQNLVEGQETIQRWTRDELLARGVPAEQIDRPDFVLAAGPLEGADRFDAEFFGFSPAEAEILDPQQRVFLECAWHALETAGYAGDRHKGAIGIYAAAGINTYLLNLHDNTRIRNTVSPYELFVSNDKDFLATRTAFKLNLRGPAVTVQTACSSSLVAVHMAVQSLLAGECDMALAGGIALAQSSGYRAREGGILSGDGHCRAFDASSTGTVPGSGVGIVVLKRLEDAIADGDTIDAVVLGSAINNDGALKASFTAPQVDSQAAVIADAQTVAGVRADSIGYIEAHGTGTALGDPIEVAALTQAFRRDTDRRGFCALGSVKSNIGHLDTAAGISGFIKAVLSLKHGRIPPSLHYTRPNPQIDFDASPFFVNARLSEWNRDKGVRRAGVSSFGIGGTNAHVVLEEPPVRSASNTDDGPQLLVLSARNAKALSKSAADLAVRLEESVAPSLADVAFTLRAGRRDFSHRQWVVARDAKTAAARLRNLADFGTTASGASPDAVFLFPGQGSQYPAMGKALYADLPIFRTRFDDCAVHLDRLMKRDIRTWLFAGEDEIHRTDLAQPALFALEYALARTWMSFGVTPRALHGHSIGEYVAACLAGVFDLETALSLVVERGRFMQNAAPGAMLAVIHPDRPIMPWLSADIALAATNAPGLSVVSGTTEAIAGLQKRLKEDGVASRLLKTSHAFHSPMMQDAATQFRSVLADARFERPRIPLISNVTGTWMTDAQAVDPDYWMQHLLQPVRFEDGTRTLLSLPAPLFIEVGPGRTLGTLTVETAGGDARIVATLGDGDRTSEAEQALAAVGRYWQLNGKLDMPAFAGRRRVALPAYPFQGERYWVEPDNKGHGRARETAVVAGPGLYRTAWHRVPQRAIPVAKAKGRFLVFDDGRIGTALAAELERAGAEPYRVIAGERFDEPDYRCFSLQPQAAEDYDGLLSALDERGAEVDHVLFVWPLRAGYEVSQPDVHARALLLLVKAIAKSDRNIGLTVVTQGGIDATGMEDLDIAQAMTGGALLVIGQEYPQLSCRHIDVDAGQAAKPSLLAKRLREELFGEGPQVALRGAHRWLPETERFDETGPAAGPALRQNGVYVVIGNTADGVGKTWGAGLSELPGVRLAFLHPGKGPLPGGIQCRAHDVDGTDAIALGQALDAVSAEWGRIDGVFVSVSQSNHRSAALISEMHDDLWDHNSNATLAPVLALAAAMVGRKVGFCCIQSSLSTMIGGLGLAAYAATHHAADLHVARENRSGTTPWFAIGYPLIEDVPGTAVQATGRANPFAVSPTDAWELTKRVIDGGYAGQTIISGGPIPPAGATTAEDESAAAHDGGRRRPDIPVAFVAPRNPVEATITGIFEEILGIEPIGVNDGFYELGGHSLLAIRAVAKLRDAFPVDVAMRELLFDNPTAAAIAKTISARMAEKTDLDAMADLLDEVGNLSDDDVNRLLAGSDMR